MGDDQEMPGSDCQGGKKAAGLQHLQKGSNFQVSSSWPNIPSLLAVSISCLSWANRAPAVSHIRSDASCGWYSVTVVFVCSGACTLGR